MRPLGPPSFGGVAKVSRLDQRKQKALLRMLESLEARFWISLGIDMGVFQMRGPFLGVLTTRIIVYWGLFWGPLFLETPISPGPLRKNMAWFAFLEVLGPCFRHFFGDQAVLSRRGLDSLANTRQPETVPTGMLDVRQDHSGRTVVDSSLLSMLQQLSSLSLALTSACCI